MRTKLDASSSGLRKASMRPVPKQPPLQVKDLIERGLIPAPTRIFGFHSGKRIQARLSIDGTFSYRGKRYSSPSTAAGQAITATTGSSPPGRLSYSVNGWQFWRVACPDGESRTLDEIRDQMPPAPAE
jgi:Restriction Enzyme Adenine Methylase Associated